MNELFESLEVTFVDREILLAIYPFEIRIGKNLRRGNLEVRNDGSAKIKWQTSSSENFTTEELEYLATALMHEFEIQNNSELRYVVKQEIVDLILNS